MASTLEVASRIVQHEQFVYNCSYERMILSIQVTDAGARATSGQSPEELSFLTGIDRAHISDLETGQIADAERWSLAHDAAPAPFTGSNRSERLPPS